MKYFEIDCSIFPLKEEYCDVLSALLADMGCETFVNNDHGLLAYIQQDLFFGNSLQALAQEFPLPGVSISYTVLEAEDKDWNQEWEENGFEPIVVDDLLCIHDTRHMLVPATQYDILINPKLAFGTGTHPTTRQLLTLLAELPLQGLRVVDAGCGTGVLGILMLKRGATHLLAYDIDEWSTTNTLENLQINGLDNATVICGVAKDVAQEGHDMLVANINRNILLGDMQHFSRLLKEHGSQLLLSGFYTSDVPMLLDSAAQYGFRLQEQRSMDDWAILLLHRA